MIEIREEQSIDYQVIREVNIQAFGQPQEADIVEKIRQNCNDRLSLVAVKDNEIAGHILFSPVKIECNQRISQGMGLAPMAVLPEFQRQGIGKELIFEGVERLKDKQCPFIIVLGHPEYYPRFGFEPASRYGIKSEWEVPDEVFMILALNTSYVSKTSGIARYRPEFT